MSITDLSGQRFGRLTIISYHSFKNKEYFWLTKCDCGNEKVLRARSFRTGRVTSCGCYRSECSKLRLTEGNKLRVGEKHPKWDPTKSNKERYRLRKNKISYVRIEAFERDNYTCQCCLKRGLNLNAHHIAPFSTNIELRYDVNNLITLCVDCHKQYHKQYKKDITLYTLNLFIKQNQKCLATDLK